MRTFFQFLFLFGLAAGAVFAGKKVISPTTSGDNDSINVTATLFLKPDEVTTQIGANPGPDIVVLQVRVTPKVDKPVSVSPDDFILLAHDDGERNQPFDPAEIAGKGALVVKEQQQDSVGTNPDPPNYWGNCHWRELQQEFVNRQQEQEPDHHERFGSRQHRPVDKIEGQGTGDSRR